VVEVSLLGSLGWSAKTDLRKGLRPTHEWFLDNVAPELVAAG
jgi:dTDP-D-glucose 4,6-dehydratase